MWSRRTHHCVPLDVQSRAHDSRVAKFVPSNAQALPMGEQQQRIEMRANAIFDAPNESLDGFLVSAKSTRTAALCTLAWT